MLLLLGAWRYLRKGVPLRYDVLYWGAVFPLGMYSAGTHDMIRVMRLEFLAFLPPLFLAAEVFFALGYKPQLRRRINSAARTAPTAPSS